MAKLADEPDPEAVPGEGATAPESEERTLPFALLELPYIPEFLLEEVRFWFVPSREEPRAVYHELVGEAGRNWARYYTKKGWSFVCGSQEGEGPFRVRAGGLKLDILEPGRIFAPRPQFRFEPGGSPFPIVSLEKRRPINEWKPNYIRALNFIKKYEWPRSLSRAAQAAIWEIEECGEIPGSVSWRNAEAMLLDCGQGDSSQAEDLRFTLGDIFFNRPEDFQLGSEVYLRVLGRLGNEGFQKLAELAQHPVTRKRRLVAKTFGGLRDPRGRHPLFLLLEDEDPGVRADALRSLAEVGVPAADDPEGKVRAYLEHAEISHRVWAAGALLAGGDEEQRKYLVQLVKEDPRPLADMGELGELIAELNLIDAVPFLIQRLKSGRREVALDAVEALHRLTGLHVEFSAQQSDEERRLAIKSFDRWWEDKKRGRRKK